MSNTSSKILTYNHVKISRKFTDISKSSLNLFFLSEKWSYWFGKAAKISVSNFRFIKDQLSYAFKLKTFQTSHTRWSESHFFVEVSATTTQFFSVVLFWFGFFPAKWAILLANAFGKWSDKSASVQESPVFRFQCRSVENRYYTVQKILFGCWISSSYGW